MTNDDRFSRTDQQTERAKELRTHATQVERRLWSVLNRKQRGVSFRRQHPLGPYFADFYCSELSFIIEVDGDWHNEAHDRRRDGYFSERGIETLRFSANAVRESLDGIAYEIDAFIRERRASLTQE